MRTTQPYGKDDGEKNHTDARGARQTTSCVYSGVILSIRLLPQLLVLPKHLVKRQVIPIKYPRIVFSEGVLRR